MSETISRSSLAAPALSILLALVCACSSSDPRAGGPITDVLAGQTMSGEPIPCLVEAGVRVCQGDMSNGAGGADLRFQSFDGVPLAVWVTLPPAPASGTDGGYPLVVQSHGWAAPPTGPNDPQYGGPTAAQWAEAGCCSARASRSSSITTSGAPDRSRRWA